MLIYTKLLHCYRGVFWFCVSFLHHLAVSSGPFRPQNKGLQKNIKSPLKKPRIPTRFCSVFKKMKPWIPCKFCFLKGFGFAFFFARFFFCKNALFLFKSLFGTLFLTGAVRNLYQTDFNCSRYFLSCTHILRMRFSYYSKI